MAESRMEELYLIIENAKEVYRKRFSNNPNICASAPGRVNLIGDHTDYNNGLVLPMALPLVTVIVGAKSNTDTCCLLTTAEHIESPKEVTFHVPTSDAPLKPDKPSWANYVKGVISNFRGTLCGFNAVIASSVPVGSGLSSSAAVEVATYVFLEALSDHVENISLQEKAKACQKAEHEFCGMPCGIMDQFISFMGSKDHAILLDCRSLNFTLTPIEDSLVSVLIANTNVRHDLASSEYSLRRKQCEEAAKILCKESLGDVMLQELEANKDKFSDVVYHRARHVITEIERTLKAAVLLKSGDYEDVGLLMKQSHKSLKYDYEVSCPELDQIVETASSCEGVYGSRMTGGGFGGCTVTLLKTSVVPTVIKKIKEEYKGNPTFYVCRPSAGAQVIPLE